MIETQPERQILKLSDLYQIVENSPMLELKVLMLNINKGNNEELKENCRSLKEYMQFVDKVRLFYEKENLEMKDAVEKAVTECIKEGILEDFLRRNRAEVVSVSIFEFDEEKEWKKIRESEYQYGLEDGIERGLEQGTKNTIAKLINKNYSVEEIADILDININCVKTLLEKV